jgi:hypothetical protein
MIHGGINDARWSVCSDGGRRGILCFLSFSFAQ